MMTLQEESLFIDLESAIDTVEEQMKLWARYDTIWALESTDEKKDGIISKIARTIRNILKEITDLIGKTMSSISNHIRYGLLSKDKKKEFDNFQEWVNRNPNIKNKKVTVKDWIRITSEYDKVANNIVKLMADDKVDARGLNLQAQDMMNNLVSLVNSATAALTVDMCMVFARKSPEMAKMVEKGLNECNAAVANIEKQLGEAEAKKLQKNINKLTKESVGQKLLATLFGRKEKDLTTCLNEVYAEFKKIGSAEGMNFFDKVKFGAEHRDFVRTGVKAVAKDKGTRKGVKQIFNAKKNIDNIKKDSTISNIASEFLHPKV